MKLMDITLKITQEMAGAAMGNEKKAIAGHLGTHFDVMNKEFPLEYTVRSAIVFDVSGISDREIEASDIELDLVQKDMFVAFHSGYIEREEYGGKAYFTEHPQLSKDLIDKLLDKGISIIGVDFAGIRRGAKHTKMDQYCADKGVFVVENLCNLSAVLGRRPYATFIANTYPINYEGMTGLPCRVIAACTECE